MMTNSDGNAAPTPFGEEVLEQFPFLRKRTLFLSSVTVQRTLLVLQQNSANANSQRGT